jgi:hypothetical protein
VAEPSRGLVQHFKPERLARSELSERCETIDTFVTAHNQTVAPFEWIKVKAYPKSLSRKYASLCR